MIFNDDIIQSTILYTNYLVVEMEKNTKKKMSSVQQRGANLQQQPRYSLTAENNPNTQQKLNQNIIEISSINQKNSLTIKISQEHHQTIEPTKRSDQSQFVNGQISHVKSGKLPFEQKVNKQIEENENVSNTISDNINIKVENKQIEAFKRGQPENHQNHHIKVHKTLSYAKKQPNKQFPEMFEAGLRKLKPVKLLFLHFCKENNLTSMKSTLFEDKQKSMEEMSLNKWMVFCKQFDILSKLYNIKSKARQQHLSPDQLALENSQIREQIKIKETKQVEIALTNIFKTSNKNATKMTFDSFISALFLVFDLFKTMYTLDQKGFKEFLSEVLHCSSEKQCFKQLSCLKFTYSTPQIQFEKNTRPLPDARAKSNLLKENQKQNRDKIKKQANNAKGLSPQPSKFHLNPVIRQAKQSLGESQITQYKTANNSRSKLVKEWLQQRQEKMNAQKELIKFFQITQDPILDSYFKMEQKKQVFKGGNK